MGKVILICGKICSGKTWYAKKLQRQRRAVILSTDEATFHLIDNEQGEFYNIFAQRVNGYLRIKAVDIVKAGANVILDWGFWTKQDREAISRFLEEKWGCLGMALCGCSRRYLAEKHCAQKCRRPRRPRRLGFLCG